MESRTFEKQIDKRFESVEKEVPELIKVLNKEEFDNKSHQEAENKLSFYGTALKAEFQSELDKFISEIQNKTEETNAILIFTKFRSQINKKLEPLIRQIEGNLKGTVKTRV